MGGLIVALPQIEERSNEEQLSRKRKEEKREAKKGKSTAERRGRRIARQNLAVSMLQVAEQAFVGVRGIV